MQHAYFHDFFLVFFQNENVLVSIGEISVKNHQGKTSSKPKFNQYN